MPTLEEDIYEILKVCRPDGYPEYKLREQAKNPFPFMKGFSPEDTLLLYKFWTCYKETAESNWRTEFFEGKATGYCSDKGCDFAYMANDIKEIIDKIDEGFLDEESLFVIACFRHFKVYEDLNLDTAVIIVYTRYVVVSAAAWASFRTTAQSGKEDYLGKQTTLYGVMADCDRTVYDKFRAILEETKRRFGMIKQGTIPTKIVIKTDAEMIEALEACTSKAKEWQKEMEKLKAENEQKVAELQAENARLRAEIAQMSAEGTQPVETNSIDKYFTLDRMAEVIKSDFNDADSALKTINIMRKMVDSDQDPAAAQAVLKKMDEVETFLKEKEKNKYGDYVNGDKIVNNHDGKESK